jgi:hypothetical protein
MSSHLLPPSSWASVVTRHLRDPIVVWINPRADRANIDESEMFCCPQTYEPDSLYGPRVREEKADRYGGIGVGRGGGSGRCSVWGELQTKGVGVTPLVAENPDRFHRTGTMTLVEAGLEAIFGSVFERCLPFSAIPVEAVVLTGGTFVPGYTHDPTERCMRALVLRRFALRPAHFLRNLQFGKGHVPAGSVAPGWSNDAFRVMQAMDALPAALCGASNQPGVNCDGVADGLSEMARRLAWQAAASFAKRLPHGAMTCSNVALNGAYLDFGLSDFIPGYARSATPPFWMDSRLEHTAHIRTLVALADHYSKYRAPTRRDAPLPPERLVEVYQMNFDRRLAIEMLKMTGITEDMALACEDVLLGDFIRVINDIMMRGNGERFVRFSGSMMDGQPTPAPRQRPTYDLSTIFTAMGGTLEPTALDRALAPCLGDEFLRRRLIEVSVAIRKGLASRMGIVDREPLSAYLRRQALRKNSDLACLRRNVNSAHDGLRAMEANLDAQGAGATISAVVDHANEILADLDPGLPGGSGPAQIRSLAVNPFMHGTRSAALG